LLAGNKEAVLPAVILGLRGRRESLPFERRNGMPALHPGLRSRYPFVFSKSDDGGGFNLCIDEQFAGFNGDGSRRAAVHRRRKPPRMSKHPEFLQEYHGNSTALTPSARDPGARSARAMQAQVK